MLAEAFSTAGLIIWGVIILAALYVCWLASRPGHRRKGQDQTFSGPDRRTDPTVRDKPAQPIFRNGLAPDGTKAPKVQPKPKPEAEVLE